MSRFVRIWDTQASTAAEEVRHGCSLDDHPPDTTRAILECLGLPIRAPPLAPPEPDSERFQSVFDPL